MKPYSALAVTFSAFCRPSRTARAAGSEVAFSCSRVALQQAHSRHSGQGRHSRHSRHRVSCAMLQLRKRCCWQIAHRVDWVIQVVSSRRRRRS